MLMFASFIMYNNYFLNTINITNLMTKGHIPSIDELQEALGIKPISSLSLTLNQFTYHS